MSPSNWLDLDNELNGNDETRNDLDFEDGDFPALKPNHDLREHAHHSGIGTGLRSLSIVSNHTFVRFSVALSSLRQVL